MTLYAAPEIISASSEKVDNPLDWNEKNIDFSKTTVIAAEIEEILEHSHDFTEEEFKKLRRKTDFILLPLLWLCYGIQQTDKTSTGTQAIFGLLTDTKTTLKQYALLTTFFYIGYLVSEFPSMWLLQRFHKGRGLSIYMLCWATVMMGIASAKSYPQLAGLRFVQGIFEASISPGFLLIIGSWYKADEQASRALVFQSGNFGFGMISSAIYYGIAKRVDLHGGLAIWRAIGYYLGGVTYLAAILCLIFLGTPSEVWWLTKRERLMASARVLSNHTGTDTSGKKAINRSQIVDALTDPQTYFILVNTFAGTIPNGALTTFGTIIFKSFGFTAQQTLIYNIPVTALGFICIWGCAIMTRKFKNVRLWCMTFFTIPPFIGLIAISLLPHNDATRWTKFGMLMMTYTFIIPSFMGWQMITSNVSGKTKISFVSALNFVIYCVGNIAGSQAFRASDSPRYIKGTSATAAVLGFQCFLLVAWRMYYVRQNKKRDEIVAAMDMTVENAEKEAEIEGAMDKTDRENIFFRYSI